MTRGEKIIRPDFAKNEQVKKIKTLYAELFDEVNAICNWRDDSPESVESNRLTTRALEDLETSAMFAVKALTV